jgi:hypothetical protein
MSNNSAMKSYGVKFMAWKEQGLAPRTRTAALRIIKTELTKVNISFEDSLIRKGLARSIQDGPDEISVDTNLAFIVWDLTENDGKAFDYKVDSNYFAGLLAQAHGILSSMRFAVKTSVGSVSIPMTLHVPGVGRQNVTAIPPKRLQEIADAFVEDARNQMLRWRTFGANIKTIKQTLRKLNREILEAYGVILKPALVKKPVKSAKVAAPSTKAAFINRK